MQVKTFEYCIFVPLKIESIIDRPYIDIPLLYFVHFYYTIEGRFLTVLNTNNSSDYPVVRIMLYFSKSHYKIRWMSIYHIRNDSLQCESVK